MNQGNFYFVKTEYYNKFPDPNLMKNKPSTKRPAFYGYFDKTTNLFWLIPISSKVEKYENIYNKKISKFNKCDTLVFGYVLGKKKAFLIQNMFPILPHYIDKQYIIGSQPVTITSNKLKKDLEHKAKKVISLVRKGYSNLILIDVLKIEHQLLLEANITAKQISTSSKLPV